MSIEKCLICGVGTSAIHYHHTIPRSCGGENSVQVPLCGNCHTTLHAHGLAIAARAKGSKRHVNQFWPSPEQEDNALPLLKVLVTALLNPDNKSRIPFQLSFDPYLYNALKVLKSDLGLSSLEKTLKYCLIQALHEKGLSHVYEENAERQKAGYACEQFPVSVQRAENSPDRLSQDGNNSTQQQKKQEKNLLAMWGL